MSYQLLHTQLNRFVPITLEEMEKVRLMNRIDSKFITVPKTLSALLSEMEAFYRIQEIAHRRICSYQTLYLDTSDWEMFLAHHNGRKNRKKIRIREYLGSDLSFLEIKDKDNKGRTQKSRLRIPAYNAYSNNKTAFFIRQHSGFVAETLFPHVETSYDRITLVNGAKTERLTIDINLNFNNHDTGRSYRIPELVIIELKQEASAPSLFHDLISETSVCPLRISKYCIGSVLTNPSLKYNRFKPKLMQINKLTNHVYGTFF